jgi:hydroxymethylglutaryl-CoA reductase
MELNNVIEGFSKLSETEKMDFVASLTSNPDENKKILLSHLHANPSLQNTYRQFSENTLSNFYLPYGIAPNFLINGRYYVVPMVIEESSVVAAAAHAAKFWASQGGFHTSISGMEKTGHVFFIWDGSTTDIEAVFEKQRQEIISSLYWTEERMKKRGGGVIHIELKHSKEENDHTYELFVRFDTVNAMGANFINSYLEELADAWKQTVLGEKSLKKRYRRFDIIMSILSNYTPHCLVKVNAECRIDKLSTISGSISPKEFADKFCRVVHIAENNISRAVTHNKGIMNGIDAVLLATGNDFRAAEAGIHAFASANGKYSALSHAEIVGDKFSFYAEFPLALGTVGGLTGLHPLASLSLEIMGHPDAAQLMSICASVGLANNFSAIRSLVTSGIQKGHMKMHLKNILMALRTTDEERNEIIEEFRHKKISFTLVKQYLEKLRKISK